MGENTGRSGKWELGARVARDITEIVAITLFCGTLVMWCMVLTGGM